MAGAECAFSPKDRRRLANTGRKKRAKERKRQAKEATMTTSKAASHQGKGNANKTGIMNTSTDYPMLPVTGDPLQDTSSLTAHMKSTLVYGASGSNKDVKGFSQLELITKEGFQPKQSSDASISQVAVTDSDSTIKMNEVCQSLAALKICSSSSDTSQPKSPPIEKHDDQVIVKVEIVTEGNLNKVKKLTPRAEETVENSGLMKTTGNHDPTFSLAITTCTSEVYQTTSNNCENSQNEQNSKCNEPSKSPEEMTSSHRSGRNNPSLSPNTASLVETKSPATVTSNEVLLDKQILVERLGLSRLPVTKNDVLNIIDIFYKCFVQRMKKANILSSSPGPSPPESTKNRDYSESFGQDISPLFHTEPSDKTEQHVTPKTDGGFDGSSVMLNQGNESPSGNNAEDIISLEARRRLAKTGRRKRARAWKHEAKEANATDTTAKNNPPPSSNTANLEIPTHQTITASEKIISEEVKLPERLKCKTPSGDKSHNCSTQRTRPPHVVPSLPSTEQSMNTNTLPVRTNTLPVSTNTLSVSTNTLSVSTSTLPVCIITLPVSTNTLPVSTSTLPVSTNTLPVSTSTIPVSTNTLPVSTSTIPVSTSTLPEYENVPSSSNGHGGENKSCSIRQRDEIADGSPQTVSQACISTLTTNEVSQIPPNGKSPSNGNSKQPPSLEERRRLAKIGRRKRAKVRKQEAKQAAEMANITKEDDWPLLPSRATAKPYVRYSKYPTRIFNKSQNQ